MARKRSHVNAPPVLPYEPAPAPTPIPERVEPTQLDRVLPNLRAREEGWRAGMIEGALSVLDAFASELVGKQVGDPVNLDLGQGLRELIRRFGVDAVAREVQHRPALLPMFEANAAALAAARGDAS